MVDCTSFAVTQRRGIERAASLDDDFASFRFGPNRRRAFEVVRGRMTGSKRTAELLSERDPMRPPPPTPPPASNARINGPIHPGEGAVGWLPSRSPSGLAALIPTVSLEPGSSIPR